MAAPDMFAFGGLQEDAEILSLFREWCAAWARLAELENAGGRRGLSDVTRLARLARLHTCRALLRLSEACMRLARWVAPG